MSEFIYTTTLDKIRRMPNRIKVVQGGSSSAKTFSILAILIDMCIKTPLTDVSVVSMSVPHLKRGAIKDFIKILQATNRYRRIQWNKSDSVYTFLNGSTINFFSVEDEGKLRGARRKILFVNEANLIPENAFTQLEIRTSGDIYIDFNPVSHFWGHKLAERPDASFIKLTYKDNEGLPQTVIDSLLAKRELAKTSDYWANWCRIYLDGEQGGLEGVVYQNWDEVDRFPEDKRLVGIGLDFGYSQDPSAAVAVYLSDGELFVEEILYEKGLLNSQIAKRLEDFKGTPVICDSAEPKSIKELQGYGVNAKPVKKGKGSIESGIQAVQEFQMHILSGSKNIINELNNYIWKKDRHTDEPTNTPIDDYNHLLDALRYLVMELLRKKKQTAPSLRFGGATKYAR